MVNPGICQKCENCGNFSGIIRDDDGRIRSTPLMDCGVVSLPIGPTTPIPEGCPYRLEHILVETETRDMVVGWEEEYWEHRNESGL